MSRFNEIFEMNLYEISSYRDACRSIEIAALDEYDKRHLSGKAICTYVHVHPYTLTEILKAYGQLGMRENIIPNKHVQSNLVFSALDKCGILYTYFDHNIPKNFFGITLCMHGDEKFFD